MNTGTAPFGLVEHEGSKGGEEDSVFRSWVRCVLGIQIRIVYRRVRGGRREKI